jgi:hypothetical protein
VLDAKRTTAAATATHIGIVEFETSPVEAFDIVDFGTVHVQEARLVDKNLQSIEFEN